MPRSTDLSPNRAAFLDTIAVSEIGAELLKETDDGYNVLVGSVPGKPLLFPSYNGHPGVFNAKYNSTAAGRYQLLRRYYSPYATLLRLPDFGPISQDKIAMQQIKERGALVLIDAGDFAGAVQRCSNIWASLPGNTYGQHMNTLAHLQLAYQNAGGKLA
jgi:muramidase (phage lysozyme)